MLRALAFSIVILATACSPPATGAANDAAAGTDATAASPSAPTGAIQATGTVTQLDAAAGTIVLEHQAIAAINWPPMTMQFHVENPETLRGIAVGDRVVFQLKSATETSTITMIAKQ